MPDQPARSGLPPPQRRLAMFTICLGVLLSGLDGIIVSVALPSIAADLQVSPAAAVWVAAAYQLAAIVSLLPFAVLGEAAGYRRVYLAGMGVFTASSLACAVAPDLTALIVARVVQGLGGGAMVGVSMALVRAITPKERLGRAIALYGLTAALSLALGPSLAAAILALAPWPWLFAVNVPIGVLAAFIGLRLLPADIPAPRVFDWLGAGLSALMFIALITGVDALGGANGWRAAALLGTAAAAAVVLVLEQRTKATPLFPLDLLGARQFSLSIATSIFAYAAQTAGFVALPFLFEQRLGLDAVATGFLLTPWPLMNVAAAPISGCLADRLPAGIVTGVALAGLAGGLLLLARLDADAGMFDIGWRMAVCGLGIGFFQTPNNRLLMTSGPPQRSGAASAMVAVARMLGQALGSASAAMAFGLFAARGAAAALLLAAGLAGAAALLSLARVRA
jgi:DHA2 family multidrug resistance protein-like MFS transporter